MVYLVECPQENCSTKYVGECKRRLIERVKDHAGRDKKSVVAKHAMRCHHDNVSLDDFKVIAGNFRNTWHRRVNEALLIRKFKPPLNVQGTSVPLKLF